MTRSGFLEEIRDDPDRAKGLTYEKLITEATLPGIGQGCGDIVTTAGDMELWMAALQSGKVVSEESFQEMTTTHAAGYGYGLMPNLRGGWGPAVISMLRTAPKTTLTANTALICIWRITTLLPIVWISLPRP